MAEVVLASASQVQKWSNDYYRDFIRESGLMPYMGMRSGSIFRVVKGLSTEGGSLVNIPLIGRLKGRGVVDSEVLEGNEEDLENLNDQVRVRWRRNGVVVPKSTSYLTEIDLLGAAREGLKDWAAENMRDRLLLALGSVIVPGAADEYGIAGTDSMVYYASSTAAQRNTFLTNNNDRILFGASKSNATSNVWATAAANVDNTNDKLTTGIASLAKRMAKTASRAIRPYRTEDGREYFVMFTGSLPFRDLKADPVMQQANRDARERNVATNPIFQDGDLEYDGIIFREIPEMPVIAGAGAGGIDIQQNFLCGQNAVSVGIAQQPTPRTDMDRDYKFRPGVATEELTGEKKTSYAGKQFGVVTVVTAAVGDA